MEINNDLATKVISEAQISAISGGTTFNCVVSHILDNRFLVGEIGQERPETACKIPASGEGLGNIGDLIIGA